MVHFPDGVSGVNWYPCCSGGVTPEDCGLCDPGTTPTAVQVTIPPLSNGACTGCDAIGGTYILPHINLCSYYRYVAVSLGACGSRTFRISANISNENWWVGRIIRVTNMTTGEYTEWKYISGGSDCTREFELVGTSCISGECYHCGLPPATFTPLY